MQRLILAGGGHAHLSVLKALAQKRRPHADIILIAPSDFAIYSGMLPGWMAGHYRLGDCRIDLRSLALAAGVRLITASVAGIDADRRCVALPTGEHLEYDFLSINVGGESELSFLEAAGESVLPIRPLDEFASQWPKVLADAANRDGYRLVVVGGGAGGVELAFAARERFRDQAPTASVTLIASPDGLLPGHSQRVVDIARRLLGERGIALHQAWAAGAEEGVALSTGALLKADRIIAATGVRTPCWLRLSKLALDDAYRIRVNARHQSISHTNVFSAGDVCTRVDVAMAPSGVHAVHAGKVLAVNLVNVLTGSRLTTYRPRKRSLYLISTGRKHAIGSWGAISAAGNWLWRVKDRIDRRFVSSFSNISTGDEPLLPTVGGMHHESRTTRKALGSSVSQDDQRSR